MSAGLATPKPPAWTLMSICWNSEALVLSAACTVAIRRRQSKLAASLLTAAEFLRYWPRTQLPSIDVYHRADHPQTDSRRAAGNRIAIGLTARDNHWAQYSFQFAHECCHALINYSNDERGLARDRRYANLWLEESLCETASLFTLRALSRSWLIAPPYGVWRDYASWFAAYAQERLALPEHHLPAGTSFAVWFRANEPALRKGPTERDRNTIVAAQLLPIFEREPRGWEALAFSAAPHIPANRSRDILPPGDPVVPVSFSSS